MNSAVEREEYERSKLFETVLSSPGIHETCKIILHPTRQTILLMVRLLEMGGVEAVLKGDPFLASVPKAALEPLQGIIEEVLSRASLKEFYEHLKEL